MSTPERHGGSRSTYSLTRSHRWAIVVRQQRRKHQGSEDDMHQRGTNGATSGGSRRTRRRKSVHLAGLAVVALALMAGCARTSVQDVQMTAPGLPRPQLILVNDFVTSPNAVSLDRAIGARLLRMAQEQPIATDDE